MLGAGVFLSGRGEGGEGDLLLCIERVNGGD